MYPKYLLLICPINPDDADVDDLIILEFDDVDDCYSEYNDYSVEDYDCAVFRRMAHSYKSL